MLVEAPTHVDIQVLKTGQVLVGKSFFCWAPPSRVKGQQPAQQVDCRLPCIAEMPAHVIGKVRLAGLASTLDSIESVQATTQPA